MQGGYHDNILNTRGVSPLIKTGKCMGVPPVYSVDIAGGYPLFFTMFTRFEGMIIT